MIVLQEFTQPDFELGAIVPIIATFAAAVIGVGVDAFAPAGRRALVHVSMAVVALTVSLVWAIAAIGDTPITTFNGALAIDGPTVFAQAAIATLHAAQRVSHLYMAERLGRSPAGDAFTPAGGVDARSARSSACSPCSVCPQTEVYPLTMFAAAGMMMFVASNDLLTMFVALEVLSLPLYVLTGLARRRRLLSQEASLKYFLLGAFASAFFLYGLVPPLRRHAAR